jgi:hypothetical protein
MQFLHLPGFRSIEGNGVIRKFISFMLTQSNNASVEEKDHSGKTRQGALKSPKDLV